MPDTNPKVPGSILYPQSFFTHLSPEPLGAIAITKGKLYSKASDSNNIIAVNTAGFENGIFQATEELTTAPTAGEITQQMLGPGSRVLLKAKDADLHAGQKVQWNGTKNAGATDDVSAWSVSTSPTRGELASYIGRIVEIYTLDNSGARKNLTSANDLVVVELDR